MARTNITATVLATNGAIVNMLNDGTNFSATDNTNGNSITITNTGVPAAAGFNQLILLVLNTNGTGRTVTIRGASSDGGNAKTGAGANTDFYAAVPGFEGAKGDLTSGAMTATTGLGIFGPFDPARFVQPDGTISVDYSGATGFVKALLVPRAVY
jgi:hypothetical protein